MLRSAPIWGRRKPSTSWQKAYPNSEMKTTTAATTTATATATTAATTTATAAAATTATAATAAARGGCNDYGGGRI